MIIKRLTMHNFGVYAGTNTFEFQGTRPIVLIGGLNGRGKTTFLEAVLISLYGPNSFAYKESTYKTYGQYLRSYVNSNDWSKTAYVEIEFQLSANETDLYIVHREWNSLGARTHEEIDVKRNGEDSKFLTDNWPMFIENILPSALSNFFFFDGEKIAELAVDDTDEKMKESIRSMLGLAVLDALGNDINKIVRQQSRNRIGKEEQRQLDDLKKAKENAEQDLQKADRRIGTLQDELRQIRTEIETAHNEYTSKGGELVKHRQKLLEKRAELRQKLTTGQENLIAAASSELPLFLVRRWLEQGSQQAEREHAENDIQKAIKTVNSLYSEFNKVHASSDGRDFIEYVNQRAKNDSAGRLYDLSDQTLYMLHDLLDNRLAESAGNANRLMKEQMDTQKKADEIESYLSVDVNENDLTERYNNIRRMEKHEVELKVEMGSIIRSRASLNGNAMKTSSEYNNAVETMLEHLESQDDADRTIRYADISRKILKEYSVRLQRRKVETLADTTTECYRKLANKKTLIDHIAMDPETLDLHYIGMDGQDVPKVKLSAGEKQLMIISILWALAKCSKKKLPVIIDTPLSRLDSAHRRALITAYFPNASEQTIILSTDTEIDAANYELMKDNIGDEFCLNYDENTKSTTISRGYFRKERTA